MEIARATVALSSWSLRRSTSMLRPSTPSPHHLLDDATNSILVVRGKNTQSKSKPKSQSSKQWLERQQKDPYVLKAQKEGLPSRSSFKLKEINEEHFSALLQKAEKKKKGKNSNNQSQRNRLIQPDMLVLDLGAAPGGWSLYASTQLNPNLGGAAVAVDLLPLDETLQSEYSEISFRIRDNLQSNFQFIQGDFTKEQTHLEIMDAFIHLSHHSRRPNLILSDMAANFTGDSSTDAISTLNLCEQALAFAAGGGCFDDSYSSSDSDGMLEDGGAFLCKYFSCGKENEADLMDAARRAFQSVHSIKPKASRKESSEMYLLALDFNCKK